MLDKGLEKILTHSETRKNEFWEIGLHLEFLQTDLMI